MPNPNIPDSQPTDADESFGDLLTQYEQSHSHKAEEGRGRDGTVISVSNEAVFVDIGYKTEGMLPLTAFKAGEPAKPGDKLLVTIKGRGPEGYYELALGKIERPKDWASLEKAFTDKQTIAGTVTGVIKGGLSVDVGVRAFMPGSRSGARDAAELERLVGQEIRCRIIKLDVTEEDVVVDRRIVGEEEERAIKQRRFSEIVEGETVSGVVRSLTDYGAFVDIGGTDGLLHVGDISWARVGKPEDVLSPGQQIEAKVLKVDADRQRISLGMKQLQPNPWDSAAAKYKAGEHVGGTVTRVAEFGAFVELEPGVEGLIHVSEMSWSKKMKKASTIVAPGESVDAVILAVNVDERRISLGLKQALGDPWAEVTRRFPLGSVVEGPVTSLTNFGAFVQLSDGVEGMIHVSDMSAEKRLDHPREMLKVGQAVRAQVLEIDTERRRLKLGMKQLIPSGLEEYIAEHKQGDVVTGRMLEVSGAEARVELAEGVHGTCRLDAEESVKGAAAESQVDLSSLTSMLQARWKGSTTGSASRREPARAGQVRSFRITGLEAAARKIELDLAE